jgi:GNAT superfamily N-acetyltransferase
MPGSQPDPATSVTGMSDLDPRTAAVEDNLLDLLTALAATPGLDRERRDDVTTWSSEVAHPLFNGVAGARFPVAQAAALAGEVVGTYAARGRPFLWWTTPSTTSAPLEQVLGHLGLRRADTPGMHLALGSPGAGPAGPGRAGGVEVRPAAPGQEQDFARVALAGSGMSPALLPAFARVLQHLDRERVHRVLALADDEPVGCGSLWVTGRTGGLYDIAVLPGARGRGVGSAVTAWLAARARELGCTGAVLHASRPGLGVYRRLGFAEVCPVTQHLWVPPASR